MHHEVLLGAALGRCRRCCWNKHDAREMLRERVQGAARVRHTAHRFRILWERYLG